VAKPQQSAQAKPADTRCDIAINDVAINGLTPATKTIQAFALAVAQMSRRALDRTTQHFAKRIPWKRLRRSRWNS
jgi:hypothetical protein